MPVLFAVLCGCDVTALPGAASLDSAFPVADSNAATDLMGTMDGTAAIDSAVPDSSRSMDAAISPDLATPSRDLSEPSRDLAEPSRDLAQTPRDLSLSTATDSAPPLDLGPPPDLLPRPDTSVPADLAAPVDATRTYDAGPAPTAIIHDIDTGVVPAGSPVTVNAVVTGPVKLDGIAKSTMRCRYSAFVQDPSGPSPSGIKLFAFGATCTPNGMTCACPAPDGGATGSPFDNVGQIAVGDVLSISGKAGAFQPTTDGGVAPPQHEIDFTSLGRIGIGGVVIPYSVTDGTQFAASGIGFVQHESELVTIHVAVPTPLPAPDSHGTYPWGGAQFNDAYRFIYGSPGGSYRAITGVAMPDFGGEILPRTVGDFSP